MNKKTLAPLAVSIFFAFGFIFTAYILQFDKNKKSSIQVAEAQSIGIPFGGPITNVYYCCFGTQLTIYDYVTKGPFTLMYYPGLSKLYEYYQIEVPGVYTVGTYVPGGSCQTGSECEQQWTTEGTITMVGTSLPG